jgi:hypothetical protein
MNFSGHWRLDEELSRLAAMAPVLEREDWIEHDGVQWRSRTRQVDDLGESIVQREVLLGGPAVTIVLRERERQLRAWEEGEALWMETTQLVSGKARRLLDCWTMPTPDLIHIDRKQEQPGGAVSQLVVLRRVLEAR